jgi:GH43 family beta-xylosidase
MIRTRAFIFSLKLPLVALAFLAPAIISAADSGGQMFANPIVSRGADPWVIRWNSNYYFCQSEPYHPNSVWVNAAVNLEDIGKDNWKCVWRSTPGTPYSKEVWAPELHFIQDKWYIYAAADDGDNFHHHMYVLEGTSIDPTQPFRLKAKIAAPEDRWAIDGTVLEMPDGKLYFIWSGWEGTDNVAQNLYIAPMSNPWTIDGPRVCISRPGHLWERQGLPINEGPEVLWHGNRLFVIYSASGMWTDDYCLGELAWNGGDVLDSKSWVKNPEPVFSSSESVFGPGHCSFVLSPDGKENWIVYHAHVHRGSGAMRDVRIQRFAWKADGSPDFGTPVSAGTPLPRPSGEK